MTVRSRPRLCSDTRQRVCLALLAERGFVEVFGFPPPWFSIWRREGTDLGFVTGFGIGAPAAAMVLEELVELGATRFVSLGFAGALSSDLDFDDVVVCSKALRDEGVSHHYLAPARYSFPSPTLSAQLLRALSADGEPVSEGPSWTIDAIFRETIAEATAYRDEGILTVEMEAAALFAVGEVLGVDRRRHLHHLGSFACARRVEVRAREKAGRRRPGTPG